MTHYAVAICTAQRPQMLRVCLQSILSLTLPKGARLSIIVVDNDPSPNTREAAESFKEISDIPVHYCEEPKKGIPFARNTALRQTLAQNPDWIALIDDDERADPDWLVKLAAACARFEADVANGPVRRIYEKPPPHWWKAQSLKARPTGTPIREAPTNNILMNARLVREEGLNLRFDERLTYGAEDIDFFRRAYAAGAKMIWVEDAFVEEEIPASRVAPRRLLNRLNMAAASGAYNMVLRQGILAAGGKFIPKVLRRFALAALAMPVGLLIWPFRRRLGERFFYYGLTRIAKASGNLYGLFGYRHNYYNQIDGH